MPLQSSRLALSTLSVVDDKPPTGLQPRLRDGVHLRWSFDRQTGFPWYGYYLFRRRHTSGDRPARNPNIGSLVIQPGSTKTSTADGELSSDSSLIIDVFSGSGTTAPGLDLSGRTYLRFIPSELANRVMVRVGMRSTITTPIIITAWPHDPAKGGTPLVTSQVRGTAGDILETSVEADGIAAVQISSGDAVLLHLEFTGIADNALAGWTELPGIPYPLALPLSHPDYPASVGAVSTVAAEATALSRIGYGPASAWAGDPFQKLHGELVNLVQGGPAGLPMAEKATSVLAPPPHLSVPTYYSLELVLVGALHPAVAQMVGLYWVDRADATGQDPQFRTQFYDYLIVAARGQSLGTTAVAALQWLRLNGFGDVDAFIAFNKTLQSPAPPLAPPSGVECYALPSGGMLPTDAGPLRNNNAGLRWEMNGGSQQAVDVRPVMYHVWRTDLGSGNQPTPAGNFTPLTVDSPVVVAGPVPPQKLATPPPDWPPVPLWYLDTRLADGWHGYQVSGVDLFGRHSAGSTGPWRQWVPPPVPPPWYFRQPPAFDLTVHPTAVRLLDDSLPPPPTGIEAAALDDADPMLIKDAKYQAWRAGIEAAPWFQALTAEQKGNLIGLRVRWIWTHTQMREAPGVQEFRIYFQPDHVNVLQGQVTAVIPVGSIECDLTTTIQGNPPANSFAGAWIRVSNEAFKIVSTLAGSPLRLRVTNIGPKKDVRPAANKFCSIVIPENHPEFVDYADAKNWSERWTVVAYSDPRGVDEQKVVADSLGNELAGTNATVTGNRIDLDASPDVSNLVAVGEHIVLDADQARADKSYLIVKVDDVAKRVWVAGTPATGGAPSGWKIVYPRRRYDVLLPMAGDADHTGVPLLTPLAKPIAYAQVSVSAADGKPYVTDGRTSGRFANRPGSEGPVGAKATIFRVRREPPQPPALPPYDSDLLWATRADYLSHSFFTFRWVPVPDLKTHLLRALEESVFDVDWEKPASERIQLDPVNNNSHRAHFPAVSAEPRWDNITCQQVANELNALNALKASGAARAVALAAYRALSNDALRVLAGLPGNERAFSQITIQPLDASDSVLMDRRGPDSPNSYVANATLRAFQDTLDGRSSNRFFYRAGSVDGAHNRSIQLSASTPPVMCPDVVAPLAPSITKVLGGDRQILIRWASNREPDLASYRVYRCDSEADARDVRLMTLVGTIPPVAGEPDAQPAEMVWTDSTVLGGKNYYYRLVAIDTNDNASDPSPALLSRAYDDERPEPPVWRPAAPTIKGVKLTFTLADTSHRPLVQRREAGAYGLSWDNLTAWLPSGTEEWEDSDRIPGREYTYRLRVQDNKARVNRNFVELTI